LSSNTYDGGTNINFRLLKRLAEENFSITGFGTNLSRKALFRRGEVNFEKFVIVRRHSDEPVHSGIPKNTFAMLRSRDYLKEVGRRDFDALFTASDFWPDSLPGFWGKLRKRRARWIASFYLFAPKPWEKNTPYRGSPKIRLVGILYWLTQLPIYHLVKRYADIVLVTSEPDARKFRTKKRGVDSVVVVQGGVDLGPSESYLASGNVIPPESRKYDACFIGRLHYQKGVIELLDIWKMVCRTKADARLAMIGTGPLEGPVREKIQRLDLDRNVDLLGFRDGEKKFDIFRQSRVVVHPATYDSGGMASCEAMAWDLPGVSFDLEALRSYYPRGMVKVPCYDLEAFADAILRLLSDGRLYAEMKNQALSLARSWDWERRSGSIVERILQVIE
jgi:glycosyltransferase involved in cell wall biosynthesis